MLNFIKEMLKEEPEYINDLIGMRICKHLPTKSGYSLSVQCSETHYCIPRKLTDIDLYEAYEFAIFMENEFVYPSNLVNFSRKDELEECYDGSIFSYVPKDLVEDLYNYLNE